MPLTLNKRVWVLAERLFLHCHDCDYGELLNLLKRFDIDYEENEYENLLKLTGPRYTFMSEENYAFANFMELIATYKYLPLLEGIVFDECVKRTRSDKWNYYGEDIKYWYPSLLDLIKLAGVIIDRKKKRLIFEEEEEKSTESTDFVSGQFGDNFIDYILKELNESFKSNLMLSTMFLARKILEVVCIRIMEVVFPKLVNKKYTKKNHSLWYDKGRGKYHNLGNILDNMKSKASKFHEDKDIILEFISLVKPFKKETNTCVHSDYMIPNEPYIKQWKIPYIVNVARRLFRKYCNP